jgi:hypothetical protein
MAMRASLFGFVAAALLATPAHALVGPIEDGRLPIDPPLVSDIVADTEHFCLTLALYFEGGSTYESEEGQRHIARVITERAKANRRIWGGRTLCGVVFYRAKGVCQFSFACLPQARRTPRKNHLWEMSAAIAGDALAGRNDEPDELIRYYMNEELTPLRNACRFRKEFVPVVKAGRHEFFREPASWERKEIARGDFDVCKRYEASLKKKKRKGKKAMAAKGGAKPKVAKAAAKPKAARKPGSAKVAER